MEINVPDHLSCERGTIAPKVPEQLPMVCGRVKHGLVFLSSEAIKKVHTVVCC